MPQTRVTHTEPEGLDQGPGKGRGKSFHLQECHQSGLIPWGYKVFPLNWHIRQSHLSGGNYILAMGSWQSSSCLSRCYPENRSGFEGYRSQRDTSQLWTKSCNVSDGHYAPSYLYGIFFLGHSGCSLLNPRISSIGRLVKGPFYKEIQTSSIVWRWAGSQVHNKHLVF